MTNQHRRATVMLIQRGDPEIAEALVQGMIAGKAEALKDSLSVATGKAEVERATRTSSVSAEGAATFPKGEGFWEAEVQPAESMEIYTVEQDKWRRVARQVRVAVGNDRTAEDYRQLIVKARGDYAVHTRPGPLHTFAGKMLLAWALICEGIRRAYQAQDRVLKP